MRSEGVVYCGSRKKCAAFAANLWCGYCHSWAEVKSENQWITATMVLE
jgi:hypothetical protein